MSAATIVAVVALSLLIYTYLGYPLLLGLAARLMPWQPKPDANWEPSVSICVAAYNCRTYLDAKLTSLVDLDYPAEKLEILVYSDGSNDGTDAVVSAWAEKDPRVRLLKGETRRGKPTALNRMREDAKGEVLVVTDARQPVNREALRAMLRLLAAPQVGCVTGNLVLEGGAGSGMYWRYEKWIRMQESRLGSVVGMTGSLSALRRCDMVPLAADLILDDVWIPMSVRLQGKRILFAENAIAWDQAFSDEREFGRKVRTLAGNYQLFTRMPRLLLPFLNPSWFETVSHKVTRLLGPWLLLLMLLTCATASLTSSGWERQAAAGLLAGQFLLYGLAAAGGRAGRLGTLARTFVVLNAAALVGLWRFLVGRQKGTW